VLSPAETLASLPDAEREAFLSTLTDDEAGALLHDWRGFLARPDQIAPEGDWDIWCIIAGRGFGKTRSGTEWIKEQVMHNGAQRIALIGETQRDLEKVMIEGDSGLLACCPPGLIVSYNKKPVQINFVTGAIALGYNATEPDQLRGPQFDTAWSDELAKWRYARETWDQLQFGLRLGDHPRQLVTTTPRPIELIKSIIAGHEGKVVISRGRTTDNRANLAASFLEKIENKYGGTRLGRQELNGEILGDIPNALWSLQSIDTSRVRQHPQDLRRILVAVDPAVTNSEQSDEHGIVAVGQSKDGKEGFVLEDASTRGSPMDWARRAIAVHDSWEADGIVVEVNQGGDMVAQTLRSVRSNIKIVEVRATRGKHVRAEPIASLYEQGRIHHVGSFVDLETQMTQMTTAGFEGDGSPDRLDALVWGLTVLFPSMVRETNRPKVVDVFTSMPMARR
jgi:phage terminase large subunit-like protein